MFHRLLKCKIEFHTIVVISILQSQISMDTCCWNENKENVSCINRWPNQMAAFFFGLNRWFSCSHGMLDYFFGSCLTGVFHVNEWLDGEISVFLLWSVNYYVTSICRKWYCLGYVQIDNIVWLYFTCTMRHWTDSTCRRRNSQRKTPCRYVQRVQREVPKAEGSLVRPRQTQQSTDCCPGTGYRQETNISQQEDR